MTFVTVMLTQFIEAHLIIRFILFMYYVAQNKIVEIIIILNMIEQGNYNT